MISCPPLPRQAPDVRSRFGVFPLQLAGWANSAEAAEAMLAAGAPPDTRDDGMRTAGHAAAASDASEALEVLLSFGAHREVRGRGAVAPGGPRGGLWDGCVLGGRGGCVMVGGRVGRPGQLSARTLATSTT